MVSMSQRKGQLHHVHRWLPIGRVMLHPGVERGLHIMHQHQALPHVAQGDQVALVGLGGSWNLSLDIEGGYIKRIGNDKIPLFDRFYIGDSTMRGFDLRGLGPKIRPSGVQPAETVGIGGRAYYVVRTELSVAVGGMWGANGVRPGIFIDAGSVFAADRSGTLAGETLLGNSAKPRISLGIGIAMNTPVGRLRIDFAKPILKQLGDRGKLLSVSFGTAM